MSESRSAAPSSFVLRGASIQSSTPNFMPGKNARQNHASGLGARTASCVLKKIDRLLLAVPISALTVLRPFAFSDSIEVILRHSRSMVLNQKIQSRPKVASSRTCGAKCRLTASAWAIAVPVGSTKTPDSTFLVAGICSPKIGARTDRVPCGGIEAKKYRRARTFSACRTASRESRSIPARPHPPRTPHSGSCCAPPHALPARANREHPRVPHDMLPRLHRSVQ